MMSLGIVLIIIGLIFIVVSMTYYLGDYKTKKIITKTLVFLFRVLFIIIFPLIFLMIADPPENDCCNHTAIFSPESKLIIYVLIGLSIISYFIAVYRQSIFPPVIEIVLNTVLLIGFVLSILVHIHIFNGWNLFASVFCVPISLFFIFSLRKRHKLLISYFEDNEIQPGNRYNVFAWSILTSGNKFIYLILLCFPVLFLIASALLLFGQRPDAMIRVFTDTYKHNFSQLDYLCENVECGGHYLCSVAANGHTPIVKPIRKGQRLGRPIICNRQLLISNAFEELINQKAPLQHRIIRKRYDRVGDMVHRYYGIFSNKYVSDIVYIVMKPLEWFFVFTLYCFDKNPKNRIAKQYIS